MARSLEQSHSPKVQDIQPSQACNGRQGTAGQDQTLSMDEVFLRSQTVWNRKKDKVPRRTKCKADSGIFKNSDVWEFRGKKKCIQFEHNEHLQTLYCLIRFGCWSTIRTYKMSNLKPHYICEATVLHYMTLYYSPKASGCRDLVHPLCIGTV